MTTKARLSADDEAILWRRFKRDGCQEARRELIEAYRPLIVNTQQRIVPTVPIKVGLEDIHQAGQIALIKSVDKFNPKRGFQFTSYAISYIRGAMLEHLRQEDWVPRSVRTKQKTLKAATHAVEMQVGSGNAKPEEVAEWLRLEIDAFWALYAEANILNVVSFDDVRSEDDDDEDPLVYADNIPDPHTAPESTTLTKVRNQAIWEAVAHLPLLERRVVEGYYLGGLTLKQIAHEIGRSESRAHQLHAQATERLRRVMDWRAELFIGTAATSKLVIPASEVPHACREAYTLSRDCLTQVREKSRLSVRETSYSVLIRRLQQCGSWVKDDSREGADHLRCLEICRSHVKALHQLRLHRQPWKRVDAAVRAVQASVTNAEATLTAWVFRSQHQQVHAQVSRQAAASRGYSP